MGKEIDLLINYPKSKRDPLKRLQKKSPYDQKIARKFGKNFLMENVNMDMVDTNIILNFGNQ